MSNCYSFHTYLLQQLKKSHTLEDLEYMFNEIAQVCCVDKYKLSKWINSKQPIPQKYIPYVEEFAKEHLEDELTIYIDKYFGISE